jgi:UrcA family protein
MLKSAYAPSGLLALAFAAGIAALGGPASSEPATAQGLWPDLTETVQYGDLDLTTDAGRAKLQQRVRTAARDVCEEYGPSAAMNFKCERQAEARAAAMEARVIAEANGRAYAAMPADHVAVAAAAKGP